MATDEKYASTLLGRVFEEQLDFDRVWLVSHDHQRFPIHRIILCAASKYFAASSSRWDFEGGARDEFPFEDVDGATLKAIVDYCYTGRIDLTEANVKVFLIVASSVGLDLLEAKCREFYSDKLSVSNAVEGLTLADRYNYADLRERAFKLVCANFAKISPAETQQLDHSLYRQLLQFDNLNAPEDLICRNLLEWPQIEMDEREQHMPEMLKLIRLEHVTAETLENILEPICKKLNCLELLWDEYKRRARAFDLDHQFTRRRCVRTIIFVIVSGFKIKIAEYDIILQRYEETREIPIGDLECGNVNVDRNEMYVMGGYVINGRYTNSVFVYNTDTLEREVLPPMRTAREYFTSVLYGNWIYVLGGNTENGIINLCERFDTQTKTWHPIKPMYMASVVSSAIVFNGRIIVAHREKAVESYDPASDSWTQLASMNNSHFHVTLIESNGFLWAFGFEGSTEKYNPKTNRWNDISTRCNSAERIMQGINVDGELFAVNAGSEVVKIVFDENDEFSFVKLCDSYPFFTVLECPIIYVSLK